MAVPALMEPPLDERAARIESHVEHMQSVLTDVKVDIREIRKKIDDIDQKLSAKIDGTARWAVGIAVLLLGAMGAGYSSLSANISSLASRQDAAVEQLTGRQDAVVERLTGRQDAMVERLTSSQEAMARDFAARLDATAQQLSSRLDATVARQDKMADQLTAIAAAVGRLEAAGKRSRG